MFETEDGSVVGSVDRARLEELQGSAESAPEVEVEEIDPEATDAVEPMSELDKLREEAEALGIKVDGRWGEERLRDEIAAYDAAEGEE